MLNILTVNGVRRGELEESWKYSLLGYKISPTECEEQPPLEKSFQRPKPRPLSNNVMTQPDVNHTNGPNK